MLNGAFKSYCVICTHMGDFPKFGHTCVLQLLLCNVLLLCFTVCMSTTTYYRPKHFP